MTINELSRVLSILNENNKTTPPEFHFTETQGKWTNSPRLTPLQSIPLTSEKAMRTFINGLEELSREQKIMTMFGKVRMNEKVKNHLHEKRRKEMSWRTVTLGYAVETLKRPQEVWLQRNRRLLFISQYEAEIRNKKTN